jgi:hypothetical protein
MGAVTTRESYKLLLQHIASGSAVNTEDIIQRLQRHEPIESILESKRRSLYSLASLSDVGIEQFGTDQTHSVAQARPMTGNYLVPPLKRTPIPPETRALDAHTPPRSEDYRWTQVTEDKEFVEHLLDIYFMWQHCFFQNFPETLFRRDYHAGQTRFCSRVLVNAICAAGCLLSDRPEARGDSSDPKTAGAAFFEEGVRLLNQSDRASIPTTAGVFVLSHIEGYRARLGAMWGLVGRSARMALDLGLHLRNESKQLDQMEDKEHRQEIARIHAFWGCFISDQ